MNQLPPSNAHRHLGRPSRGTTLAFVVLSVMTTALVAPPAGLAQDPDPFAVVDQALDGGGVPVSMDVETGIEDAIEAGGVPAVLESPPEPAPSPAPVSEPQSDVPSLPDTGMPSETAPVPAPESQPSDSVGEESNPGAPGAPINLNVDIRILSPGDNGDVTQEISVPGWSAPVGDGAQGQPFAWTWNWTWNWTTPAADDVPEVGDVLGEVLGSLPEEPGQLFADPPVEEPAVMQPHEATQAPGSDRPPPRRDAAGPGGAAPRQWSLGGSNPHSLTTVAGSPDGAASVTEAARPTLGPRHPDRGHAQAPEQAPPALPSAAASSVGGGSSAPFAAAILGLLCLLAPRVLELLRSPHGKLSSQLSSSRLERPG
jgi:hypothetical protein